jgi:hypothetical protein
MFDFRIGNRFLKTLNVSFPLFINAFVNVRVKKKKKEYRIGLV